jgi:hypothetical protein
MVKQNGITRGILQPPLNYDVLNPSSGQKPTLMGKYSIWATRCRIPSAKSYLPYGTVYVGRDRKIHLGRMITQSGQSSLDNSACWCAIEANNQLAASRPTLVIRDIDVTPPKKYTSDVTEINTCPEWGAVAPGCFFQRPPAALLVVLQKTTRILGRKTAGCNQDCEFALSKDWNGTGNTLRNHFAQLEAWWSLRSYHQSFQISNRLLIWITFCNLSFLNSSRIRRYILLSG